MCLNHRTFYLKIEYERGRQREASINELDESPNPPCLLFWYNIKYYFCIPLPYCIPKKGAVPKP